MQKQGMLVAVLALMAVVGSAMAQPMQVNCDAGDSLAAAVAAAQPGTTIQVSGTCNEDVTITVDHVTLDGGGTAVIDGSGASGQPGAVFAGLLTVDGAQGVIITGLTVQNSSVDGILVRKGAAATVQNTTVKDSADDGIQVTENANAQLINCTVEGSGEFGIIVGFNAAARVLDKLVSQNNGSYGLIINDAGEVVFGAGTMEFNNNGGAGIFVFTSSSLSAGRTGPTVTVNGNVGDGILLAENAQFRVSGGTLTASQNGANGLVAVANSIFVTEGTTVNLSGNTGSGMIIAEGAQVTKLPPGELNIQNNQVSGIIADFGSTVNFLGSATITDNGPADARSDLNFSFGTMANVEGENNLGIITCDATVLLRGNFGVMCPTP